MGLHGILSRAPLILALTTCMLLAPMKGSVAQGSLQYIFKEPSEQNIPLSRDPLRTEADYYDILSRWRAISRAFSGQGSGLIYGNFGDPYVKPSIPMKNIGSS